MLIVMIDKQDFTFSLFFLVEIGLVSFLYDLWKVCGMMAENIYAVPFSPQVVKVYLSSQHSALVDECLVSPTKNRMTTFPCYLVMY